MTFTSHIGFIMLCPEVPLEDHIISELCPTQLTLVWFLSCVSAAVHGHALREALATYVTSVWPLSCMNSHVPGKVVFVGNHSATDSTLVRIFWGK